MGNSFLQEPDNTSSPTMGESSLQLTDAKHSTTGSELGRSPHNILMMVVPGFGRVHQSSRQVVAQYWSDPLPHVLVFGVVVEYCALACLGGVAQYDRDADDAYRMDVLVHPVHCLLHQIFPGPHALYCMEF